MPSPAGTLQNHYTPDYVIFDLETTGISTKYDEVIEISAIKVLAGQPVEEFTTLVNPGRRIPWSATRVNGITDQMVEQAPPFRTALKQFLDFADGLTLVGHNIAHFDMNFLYRDSKKYFDSTPQNHYVDTLLVARKHLKNLQHHRLTDLAEYYHISTEGAHRALNDCRMNLLVYEAMIDEMRRKRKSAEPSGNSAAAEQADSSSSGSSDTSHSAPSNENRSSIETAKRTTASEPVDSKNIHHTVRIRGVVERITYQNPDNGYTVLKCAVKNYKDLVTVVGNLLDINVGSVLLVDGNWKVDSRYGRQFLAESWEETLPATVFGIEKYLGSGLIKGVGPKFARRIVQKFGTDTIDIIETDTERLLEVDGIGKKRVKTIQESWEKQKEIKNVMIFLQEHGVSTSFAARIYKQYGNESIDKMKDNPYRLADDIWGIGFKTADGIAEKLGFGKESYVRLRSGIMYTLSELSNDGHVYAGKEQLIGKAAELLEADPSFIVMTLDHMLKDKDLILEENLCDQTEAIYLQPFYYAEVGAASKLKRLQSAPAEDCLWQRLEQARKTTGNADVSVDIGWIEKKVGMQYDEIQADAIRKAAASKVMILTGGPGTGKTTTTQGIIAAFRSFGLKILLAAPTGRAAKRMTEATGLEAKTIHRLLECKPPNGYQKNEESPLEGDVLILDECSMIDLILMNALLKAIPPHMRLVMVGDIDQLPSVGAGNVLRDIIDSGIFPVIRLTRIFRQAQTSRIIMNAHRINEGRMPDISNGKNTDFFFMAKEDPEEAVQLIIELVQRKLPAYYKVPAAEIQVLTPMQRTVVGASNLNLELQQALNPEGEGLRRSGYIFRVSDKVMQIKNNYDKEVFNGDIGMIESVDPVGRTLSVNFDGKSIGYDVTELDELVHAYATTIHKAQGSEYPIVVMPVMMNHYVMLQRNLIYTGITRAKKILVLVGTKKALSIAVRNVTVNKRNTLLKERLSEKNCSDTLGE